MDPGPIPVSLLLLLVVEVSVLFCVGGVVRMTLVSVAEPEPEPGTGVGVCIGPPGFVKLSSPALKLEQIAWPALTAKPKSSPLQFERRQPPTLLAMTL